MDTSARKIILTIWRDTAIATASLYFVLLILDSVLNEFVQALLPITGIGWFAAAAVLSWLVAMRSTKS